MFFKKYFYLFFIVIALVGCSKQDFSSPLLFAGEGEDWIVEMVIDQKGDVSPYHATYRYNITYKKDDKKHIQKWVDGKKVFLKYYIKGLDEDMRESREIAMFHGNQDYWISGVDNNSFSEPYTEEAEFEVVVKLDGKRETFTLSFDEDRTEDLKNIDGNVINDSLKGPIGVEYDRIFKGALIK